MLYTLLVFLSYIYIYIIFEKKKKNDKKGELEDKKPKRGEEPR